MEKRVKISESLSVYIEKLFFEYNASLNILRYLSAQDDVHQEYLDKYFKDATNKFIELELAKKEASNKYRPKDMCNSKYNFDFDTFEIVYTGGGCHE